jgi:GxxExxY protein
MTDEQRGHGWRAWYPHGDVTGAVLNAFYRLQTRPGSGFLESVYKNGLTLLLREAGAEVAREVPYDVMLHGQSIGHYRADLVVNWCVLVEVKTARRLDPAHVAQLRNFGERAQFRRLIVTPPPRDPRAK